MKCPHCDVDLIPHIGGLKDGTYHCNKCGCCMYPNGKNREGHTGCGRPASRLTQDSREEETNAPKPRARRTRNG